MPRNEPFLLEQVARARRFAQAMNTDADRERFEKLAADYERELDAPERLTAKRPAYRPRRGEGPRQPLTMPLRPRRVRRYRSDCAGTQFDRRAETDDGLARRGAPETGTRTVFARWPEFTGH